VAAILARPGRFALVEGKIVSVHRSGSVLYVNFGRRWSRDFTATLYGRSARNFAAAKLDLKALAGQVVLVRGFVGARGGSNTPWHAPWIELEHPEQIEPVAGP
jgi:hypothetical protein